MKFPVVFKRYVGGPEGEPVLGDDELPSGKAHITQDNALFCRFNNVNGWPVHRVAVTYAYQGEGDAPTLTGTMYFYEDTTATWYQIGASGASMVPGTVTFFDVIAILEMPNTTSNLANATPGSIAQVLIVNTVEDAPDGTYLFGMAPDLTTQA